MPKFLEKKLKKEYGENSKTPFKVMNAIGAMHGNKETKKGKQMEMKHNNKSLGLGSSKKKKKLSFKKKPKSFSEALNN